MIELTPNIHLYEREEWGARYWREYVDQGWRASEAFLHHGAEPGGRSVDHLAEQKSAMRGIQNFHMDVRGWDDIAYHYVVFQPYGDIPFARIFAGRPRNHVPAAQEHHNTGTLAICVYGDFSAGHDVLEDNTIHAIEVLLRRFPRLETLGPHSAVVDTDCPGANIRREIPRIAKAVDLSVYKG
jgi:hypothetical protein